MTRAITFVLALTMLVGCKAADQPGDTNSERGTGGSVATGGRSGTGGRAGSGGSSGSGGANSSGGATGSGGTISSGGATGSGGSTGTGGTSSGTGGASTGTGGSSADAATDVPAASDAGGGSDRPGILGEGADYPGRPEVRICPKDWSHEQCCQFLCRCLNDLCTDSPKGKPGIASCMTWCPKLSNMAMRCHVYHCFESVSMGGKKDHDSHCGHAADQVAGGMCRADVYN
jgi:hypothetical protein